MAQIEIGPGPAGKPDSKTFEALCARYRAPLLRYLIRRGFTPDVAEDCVQEVLLRMARTDLAAVSDIEAYIFTVASSVAVDQRRKMTVRYAGKHESIEKFEIESKAAGPSRVYEGKEAILRLDRALDELSARTREIFLLNRLDGLSYTQLAVRFGVSVAAIEKRMSKALAHLRKRLPRDE